MRKAGKCPDIPARHKLGYAAAEERAAIERQLLSEGYPPNSPELHFAVVRKYEQNHAYDLTYDQRTRQWLANQPIAPSAELTEVEIDYLLERLEGVNDPLGQAVVEKLLLQKG